MKSTRISNYVAVGLIVLFWIAAFQSFFARLGSGGERILGYRYRSPEEGDDGWKVADAAAEGVDTSKIGALMRRVLAGDSPNLHSVVVVKDGKIIVDEYFHGFHLDNPIRSLISICVQRRMRRLKV